MQVLNTERRRGGVGIGECWGRWPWKNAVLSTGKTTGAAQRIPSPSRTSIFFFPLLFPRRGLLVLASIYFTNEFNSTVFHGCTATRSNEMHKLVALTVCPEQIILPTSL